MGRDGVVGIATRYGLFGPEIELQRRRDFRTRTDRPSGPPGLFSGGKAAGSWR